MTIEEAIRNIKALNAVWGQKPFYDNKFEEALDMAVEALKQEPKTEWIPVSEGLPKKNMACFVTVGKLNLVQIAMYSDLMKTINHRIFYQGNYGKDDFKDITQYVKAWCELPEPYKESEG